MNAEEVHFCPRCGTLLEWADRFGRSRPVCPACDWIFFADPKVAVAVLIRQGNSILLVRRINEPFQGDWTLPAGFVDAGEDPARAAERECLEETNLKVHITGLVDVIAGQEHPRGAHILIVYQAEVLSGSLAPGDDADGAAYYPLDHLPKLAFKSTYQLLTKLQNQRFFT